MAIRTKAELRTQLAAMFADNDTGEITPEDLRAVTLDAVDSLLDEVGVVAGSGITVSRGADGTVTIAAGGAAAASGIPSFVADSAAQPSDDVITATIAGLTASPPFPSLVYLLTPNDLDRSDDDSGASHQQRHVAGAVAGGLPWLTRSLPATWTPARSMRFLRMPVRNRSTG